MYLDIKTILLSFLVSFGFQWVIIKLCFYFNIFIDCNETDFKPQVFHDKPTPRAGGMGIFLGVATAYVLSEVSLSLNGSLLFLFVIASSLPAFIAGIFEDYKRGRHPVFRLASISSGALIAIVLLNVMITDIGFKLPFLFAVPFTIFAVCGVTNAINIVDGLNGLASGVSLIAIITFAFTSYFLGDFYLLNTFLILGAGIFGFFLWNFSKGRIFLGDSGSYFIGFILAQLSVILVNKYPEISPWFPVIVLSYPIIEVLFSIYRRKVVQGHKSMNADKLHMHSLIYKRFIRNNPQTSIFIMVFIIIINILAFIFRRSTALSVCIFLILSAIYVLTYQNIVNFKIGKYISNTILTGRKKEPENIKS